MHLLSLPHIESMKLDELIIASPDVGGSKRANTYAKYLNAPMVICHKHRAKANEVSEMRVIGDVKGKRMSSLLTIWLTPLELLQLQLI